MTTAAIDPVRATGLSLDPSAAQPGPSGAIERRFGDQVVRIEAWGPGAIRVRCALHRIIDDIPHCLLDPLPATVSISESADGTVRLAAEDLSCELDEGGHLVFRRADGTVVLEESPGQFWSGGARRFTNTLNTYSRIEQRFAATTGERIYGLGQHRNGVLDHRGRTVDLVQRNAEINIPFYLSSRRYGFLWNSPAVGQAEFGVDATRWVADLARQIDYVVFVGDSPAQILSRYADATGHAPRFPSWATGLWQSKLRYRTQEELLGVAREYHRRGIPISLITADFFHWTRVGELTFDPVEFPDPAAMVAELDELGVRLMVSIWPSLSLLSPEFTQEQRKGHLVSTERGVPLALSDWNDKGFTQRLPITYYDATNPEARQALWARAVAGYYNLGVRTWWLDACEPEIRPEDHANLRFHAGLGSEVANAFPREHARGFHEGMGSAGEEDVLLFCRSAFAGSQRYGAAVWSGDIETTFASLADQVKAGLSIGIAGIPWWTTDTGGFHGGDPDDPSYRELLVRWFEFSVFCPILRMHGHREPRGADNGSTRSRDTLGPLGYGGPNELWSYGEEAYEHLTRLARLRERLRPYVAEVMAQASHTGVPPMRALFLEFPDDLHAWEVDDCYLFGPSILVAPVTQPGAIQRTVYLPAGSTWRDPWTGRVYEGGASITLAAPLGRPTVLLRDNVDLPIAD